MVGGYGGYGGGPPAEAPPPFGYRRVPVTQTVQEAVQETVTDKDGQTRTVTKMVKKEVVVGSRLEPIDLDKLEKDIEGIKQTLGLRPATGVPPTVEADIKQIRDLLNAIKAIQDKKTEDTRK